MLLATLLVLDFLDNMTAAYKTEREFRYIRFRTSSDEVRYLLRLEKRYVEQQAHSAESLDYERRRRTLRNLPKYRPRANSLPRRRGCSLRYCRRLMAPHRRFHLSNGANLLSPVR